MCSASWHLAPDAPAMLLTAACTLPDGPRLPQAPAASLALLTALLVMSLAWPGTDCPATWTHTAAASHSSLLLCCKPPLPQLLNFPMHGAAADPAEFLQQAAALLLPCGQVAAACILHRCSATHARAKRSLILQDSKWGSFPAAAAAARFLQAAQLLDQCALALRLPADPNLAMRLTETCRIASCCSSSSSGS